MRRELVAGLVLGSAGLLASCKDEHIPQATPMADAVFSIETPTLFIPSPSPTERPTPPSTPEPKKDLPVYFTPTRITLEDVPAFAKGLSITQAEIDKTGQWAEPDPISAIIRTEPFPNQTLIWGHSRWQSVYQPSGYFMMQADAGDTVLIDGVSDVAKFVGKTDGKKEPVKGVEYEVEKFMVMDSRDINKLYSEDQKFEEDTIIFFTSLRVNTEYDPRRYWVIPKESFFPKVKPEDLLTDLEDPEYYGYAVAILKIKGNKEECKVIDSYGESFPTPKGFKTPDQQCPE